MPCFRIKFSILILFISGDQVLSLGSNKAMHPCDHEEADTRMCLHIKDALEKGAKTILVRTVGVYPFSQLYHKPKFHRIAKFYSTLSFNYSPFYSVFFTLDINVRNRFYYLRWTKYHKFGLC